MIVPFHKAFLCKEDYDAIEDEELKKGFAIRDEFLEKTLKKELDGIFLWAIHGLQDLLKNNAFCVPEQIRKLNKIFILRSTSSTQFFEDMVDDSDCCESIELQKLHRAYIEYCKGYKIPPESNRTFATSIRNLGFEIAAGTNNARIVRGVRLRCES